MKKVFSRKDNILYFVGLLIYTILAVFVYFEQRLDIMNTTVYAFNYKYGFISRGVLGTFLDVWNNHSSIDLISYNTVYLISKMATVLFVISMLIFVFVLISKTTDDIVNMTKWMSFILYAISIPMFLSKDNFGRLDVFLMIITILCLILIFLEKAEFLVIPLVGFAAVIHEGFVFMNLNIILVMFLYKILAKEDKKKRIYYTALLVLSFIVPSVFFLYFEFFSHTFGIEVYNEMYSVAEKLCFDGVVHKQVLQHEILGVDISGLETKHRIYNREDGLVFLILFIPYIIIGVKYFVEYFKKNKKPTEKLTALAVIMGPLTLIPEIVLKVDFGRYAYSICFYYLTITLMLVALKDRYMTDTLSQWADRFRAHKIQGLILLVYLFLFIPFRGYRICDSVSRMVGIIFGDQGNI